MRLVASGTLDSLLGDTLADGDGSGDLSVAQDGSTGKITSDTGKGSVDLLGVEGLRGGTVGLWLVGVLGVLQVTRKERNQNIVREKNTINSEIDKNHNDCNAKINITGIQNALKTL